jgi:hypothetical protein
MLNNPLCVKEGRFLYPIGTRGTTREKKSRRDQSHEEKNHRDRSLLVTRYVDFRNNDVVMTIFCRHRRYCSLYPNDAMATVVYVPKNMCLHAVVDQRSSSLTSGIRSKGIF